MKVRVMEKEGRTCKLYGDDPYIINAMLKEGWREEVKEESLVDKILPFLTGNPTSYDKFMVGRLAQIAKDYFREHPEELEKE